VSCADGRLVLTLRAAITSGRVCAYSVLNTFAVLRGTRIGSWVDRSAFRLAGSGRWTRFIARVKQVPRLSPDAAVAWPDLPQRDDGGRPGRGPTAGAGGPLHGLDRLLFGGSTHPALLAVLRRCGATVHLDSTEAAGTSSSWGSSAARPGSRRAAGRHIAPAAVRFRSGHPLVGLLSGRDGRHRR